MANEQQPEQQDKQKVVNLDDVLQKTSQVEEQTLQDVLAPPAMKIDSNYIQIGERFVRTLFVSTYPRFLNANWLSPIVNLDEVFDIAIYIHPKDTATVLKQLRDQLARLEAQAIEESEKGKVRNPRLETAINDIESLRDSLQQGTEKFFSVGLYLSIYGDSVKELDELEGKLKGMLEAQLIYLKPSTFQMVEGFTSTLPLNLDKITVHTSLNTAPISSTFPFISFDLTTDKGILYGINAHNNSLVLFDRYELENSNMVVFGKSGGGKSYSVKLNILRELMYGAQVFVIDPENEYKFLAQTLGGSFVRISVASENTVNPFDLPLPAKGESFGETFRNHVLSLTGLFRLMFGSLTPTEEAMLDNAMIQTYAVKDIYPDQDYSEKEPPLLSDLQNILASTEGADSLVIRLQKYTQGTFAGFLNKPTTISINKELTVFSIRDMEDELRPIAMYVVLNYIWSRVRKELRKRLMIVDEAWTLMKYDEGANFMLNVAKRARKYYMGLTTISQDVGDFLNSQYGRPIITNSSIQLLLKQSPATIDLVQKTFNLTESEKNLLLETTVGTGLFFAGQNHIVMRIVASYTEDQLITSDPRQLLEIQEAKKELNS